MRFTGFIGPSYTASSVNVDCQRCVNLYPEMDPLGTGKEREVASLVGTPGLKLLATLPKTPIRGTYTSSTGVLFVVAGNSLYSVSSSYVATHLGDLNTSSGPVSMSDNGIDLVVVDGNGAAGGYHYTFASSAYAQITDPNFLGADIVAYIDGYFIFNKPSSQAFYCSDLLAVTFTALNTATAEGSPDPLVGHIANNQGLYLFGSQSIEVFYDAGTTPCPFSRIQGMVYQVGCSAKFSIARMGGTIFFVGGDETGQGIVYAIQGGAPQRVSTPAIEAVIRSIGTTNLSGARAWVYQQSGHTFYCLNLPTTNSTWVYDASTSMWHERTYLGSWGLERHRADCSAVAYGLNVVGDYANGNLYALDPTVYNDNGVSVVRLRAAPHFSQDMVRIIHSFFQLDLEVGVGLSTGQGQDPQVMLQWSDDGGHTWSNEKWTSCGAIGKTRTRVIWRRLGASRDRVYRVMISDPVKVTLIGAELGVEGAAA